MAKLFEMWAEFMAILIIVALVIGTIVGGSLIWLIWALIKHFSH